uniref:Uncharacterized protein LOC104231989 n=1 Tax=Nicotiana sylvestris TaxID=4096 RepID=A0A1U7X138_NICSY|nr:PREDICTED: uncharacterized protein LOC104231989 [Nicotiana sylvestris]
MVPLSAILKGLKHWEATTADHKKCSAAAVEHHGPPESDVTGETDVEVRLDSQDILKRKGLKYLRSTIQRDGEIDGDVTHRIWGAECWPIKNSLIQKKKVAEMRILRWMYGNTKLDKIQNEDIRESVGVAPVDDKMRETRLRWFRHVQRRSLDAPILCIANAERKSRSRRRETEAAKNSHPERELRDANAESKEQMLSRTRGSGCEREEG